MSFKINFKHYFFTKAISNTIVALILISIVLASYIIASHRIHYLARIRSSSIIESYDIKVRKIGTLFSIVDVFTNENKTHILVYSYGFEKFKINTIISDNSTSYFVVRNALTGQITENVEKGLYEIIVSNIPNSRLILMTDKGDFYEIKIKNWY